MIVTKPELMSPAGHWPQLHAAIEAGADAVYFGLNHFSARAKVGFDLDELPQVMRTLHQRGVKGFVTFNTLVFDHELELAQQTLAEIARAGADAVIVQDIGMAQFVQKNLPDLPVHGSTQMSITSAEGCALAKQWGCQRVVLGRELSIRDIRQIAAATDLELEVFVHGALCVSYSGQCFSSEAWGGRSANRGQCAQACRLPYDLIVDGKKQDLGAHRYLLSPGDLYALDFVSQLCELGISCFKIEGRYKDADYVALTTQAYRRAIDAACKHETYALSADELRDLEQVYSRGLGPHFVRGVDHQQVVIGRAPRHRGVRAGEVTRVTDRSIWIMPQIRLHRGDGVVFDAAHRRSPQQREPGGFLFEVTERAQGQLELEFDRDKIDLRLIAPGDWVWRTHDPQLAKKVRPLTNASEPVHTRALDMQVAIRVGEPLRITASCDQIHRCVWTSNLPLTAAQNRPPTLESLTLQLGRLGGSPFHLGQLDCLILEPAFIPTSLLNQARREIVAALLELRSAPLRPLQNNAVAAATALPNRETPQALGTRQQSLTPMVHVLVRNPQQLAAAIDCRPQSITLDYLELYGLKSSVDQVRSAGIEVRVASPRVLKPAEEKIVHFLQSLECSILIRSTGLLFSLQQQPPASKTRLLGDFSLNAANIRAAQSLFDLGLERLTLSYDLNAEQISSLATQIGPSQIEVVAYHHLPVFHTEHCVFCRFLSSGTDNTNCGHPCETHRVGLRDEQGRVHPLMADVGCRNTVFGAEVQSATKYLGQWLSAGIVHFRLEFVHQEAIHVRQATAGLQRFLSRQIDAAELEQLWQETAPHRTTSGSYFVPKEFRSLVQLGTKRLISPNQ